MIRPWEAEVVPQNVIDDATTVFFTYDISAVRQVLQYAFWRARNIAEEQAEDYKDLLARGYSDHEARAMVYEGQSEKQTAERAG